MRYLLDTHIFLWWLVDQPKLSEATKRVIAASDNEIYVSAASTWEMIIKSAIGKLSLPPSPQGFIREQLRINRMLPLPITIEHSLALATLPMIHKDPFDRMLIAQTIFERMVLITDDPVINSYPVTVFSAE
ncbi:twitching motility protein PilT [Candidatus Vecturithrix granuli]|uniref:Twitching motility protein PilT n=1 Tax=Vecturithrix granuli TaxID=1499967 RepID=A0A081BUY8_VECG1|nr:twitching motility protein PilT [Candidatus Vecturithrix granuli]